MSSNDYDWDLDAFEEEMPMAHRIARCRRFEPSLWVADAAAFRHVMNSISYWRHCGRGECRRARTCTSPRIECAWRKLPYLQRYYFPYVLRVKADLLARCAEDGRIDRPPPAKTGKSPARRPNSDGVSPNAPAGAPTVAPPLAKPAAAR